MAGPSNAAPVIVKRRKVVAGGRHHGGAWKVAYADFVTAMMAFFLLMWLLNATTEKQRKGIADYFNPTIPINRISGGGDGAFGGDSVFSEEVLAQTGTGASRASPTAERQARGEDSDHLAAIEQHALEQVAQRLRALSGESVLLERLLRHVVTRLTDEGLVIEIFDLEDAPLFLPDSDEPTPVTGQIAAILARSFDIVTNQVAVQGHVRAYPVTLIVNPVWDLSAARAQRVRSLLGKSGLDPDRMQRVTGFADRRPVAPDPSAVRNNRVEIILLRRTR
ncbi:MAG: flagellar motor protein MotB [Gemmobacter sp.]